MFVDNPSLWSRLIFLRLYVHDTPAKGTKQHNKGSALQIRVLCMAGQGFRFTNLGKRGVCFLLPPSPTLYKDNILFYTEMTASVTVIFFLGLPPQVERRA